MTIYLISAYEHITAVCATSAEAQRLIRDHIGLYAVTRQQYERADAKLEVYQERTFPSKAVYLRWRKDVQP